MDISNVTYIKREVTIKPLRLENSYLIRNETMVQKTGRTHKFNESRTHRISASIDGATQQQLNPYTPKEAEKLLPPVISVNSTDLKWQLNIKTFWRDVLIEYHTQLKLDTSFDISSTIGKKIIVNGVTITSDAKSFKKYSEINIAYEYLFGVPINYDDYWKWRYCLVSPAVANTFNIAETKKGKKMKHYLYDLVEEIKAKTLNYNRDIEAKKLYIKVVEDEKLIESIIRTFERGKMYDNIGLPKSFKYDELNKIERLDILKTIHNTYPDTFLKIVEDKQLEAKTFIHKLVANGILNNPYGTQRYKYGEEILASSMERMILVLTEKPNLKLEMTTRLREINNSKIKK